MIFDFDFIQLFGVDDGSEETKGDDQKKTSSTEKSPDLSHAPLKRALTPPRKRKAPTKVFQEFFFFCFLKC